MPKKKESKSKTPPPAKKNAKGELRGDGFTSGNHNETLV